MLTAEADAADSVTVRLNVPVLALTVSPVVLNCTAGGVAIGSLMVRVLTVLPPSVAPLGVPSVTISVLLTVPSARSVR